MKAREKMLRLTAKYGNGINVAWAYSPEACKSIFSKLSKYCEEYGKEKNAVKKSVGFWTRHFESDSEMETAIEEGAAKRGVSLDDHRKRIASALWGTSDAIIARLKEFKKLDVSHSIFMFPDHEEVPYIKLFGESVIPKL
jgi:alkanesulfonate monooxygenase SsuD/methylene tetrahydromethanopterin reductase-like flavin-dependent oxidoreductase (luciferase family)